ncbi:MAG TPA: acetate--CoA ligase family protein, partial [Rhizomicrobium sp.]|nr:acetate--CoA ligase family protein [Rhizomicrobium sp.]
MSTRNLEYLFRPQSIALIGATDHLHAVGNVVARNLLASGFEGALAGVNPHLPNLGLPVYPDVASVPFVPDLAVICTPAPTVPGLIEELATRGTKAAIVISAGFSGVEGEPLRQRMLEAAGKHLLRIVGPNCLGVLSTPAKLNGSFAHVAAKRGRIAMVTQSGAILTTVLDWATARGIGFSHLVSMGDMSDVDFGDMLDYLASDAETDAIILYIEAVTHARKFMSAARAAARVKPVIAIKSGRHPAAAKAALSHTGALAGSDAVYEAVLRRAGILRVKTLEEVFDALETLGMGYVPHGEKLAILTNGGGAGVLATDALLDLDGTLAELSPATITTLNAAMPLTWSHGDPIDIIGDAPPERYAAALKILLDAPEVDTVLVMNCPTAVASSSDAARAVIDTCAAAHRTVITNWLGALAAEEARALFTAAKIPTYETPDEAVRGFMHMVRYRRAQDTLMQVPAALAEGMHPDRAKAHALIEDALSRGLTWLPPQDVAALFAYYAIPVARSLFAATPKDAAACAKKIGGPVVLKIVSQDIVHKSDVGGVALDLMGSAAVTAAAQAMLDHIAQAAPNARIDGFLVQEMVDRPNATELILGMTEDKTFGPIMLFGRGGTAVEVIADTTLAMPPLNMALAHTVIARTQVAKALRGYRDRKPADMDAVAGALVKLTQLVSDLDDVAEIDINPLLADDTGVIAVDARIRIARAAERTSWRMSISPYPADLEQTAQIDGLGRCFLRPVRPEDAPAFTEFFAHLTPDDIRLRFFSMWHSLPQRQLARLTQID